MNFLDLIFKANSALPWNQTPSVAQDRYTHTPITFEPRQQDGVWGLSNPYRTWGQAAWNTNAPLAGIDPNTQGAIRIFQDAQGQTYPGTLKHEVIHQATIPDMMNDPKLYAKVKGLIPDDVANTIKTQYQGTDYDPVHEGVSWLLTFPEFQDPKYNDAKQKLINAFPAATKAKLVRILGQ